MPAWTVPAALATGAAFALVVSGYIQGRWTWEGTGFSGATLWDWLELLIIPLVLGIGGIWFQRVQRRRELESQERQRESEREASDRQRQREVELEERRRQRELEVDSQRAQDAALQSYLDQMSILLIDVELAERLHNFDDKQGDKLRVLARARTLTALGQLDETRKSNVMQFLYEADLINKDQPAVSLRSANLSEAKLSRANLREANLSGANLSGAYLMWSNLSGADLSGVEGLTQEQINRACGDQTTQLSEHLKRPESWSDSTKEKPSGE